MGDENKVKDNLKELANKRSQLEYDIQINSQLLDDLGVGYYPDVTSWRTVYDLGISDILFGILNTSNITTMPATPTGTATGIRFACTLY